VGVALICATPHFLSFKVAELLSKRTDVARRLNELRLDGTDRRKRKAELEKSLFLLQKKKVPTYGEYDVCMTGGADHCG
jgi:hypothetical protein